MNSTLRLPLTSDELAGRDTGPGGELDISEPFIAPQLTVADAGQVQVLDLPRRVVSPGATPYEAEVPRGPLMIIRAPLHRPGKIVGAACPFSFDPPGIGRQLAASRMNSYTSSQSAGSAVKVIAGHSPVTRRCQFVITAYLWCL
jgi:hypothetical protein